MSSLSDLLEEYLGDDVQGTINDKIYYGLLSGGLVGAVDLGDSSSNETGTLWEAEYNGAPFPVGDGSVNNAEIEWDTTYPNKYGDGFEFDGAFMTGPTAGLYYVDFQVHFETPTEERLARASLTCNAGLFPSVVFDAIVIRDFGTGGDANPSKRPHFRGFIILKGSGEDLPVLSAQIETVSDAGGAGNIDVQYVYLQMIKIANIKDAAA